MAEAEAGSLLDDAIRGDIFNNLSLTTPVARADCHEEDWKWN
jgi:hypothetical protein